MPTIVKYSASEDRERGKLLALLEEYTGKLRIACEKSATTRERRLIFAAFGSGAIILFFATFITSVFDVTKQFTSLSPTRLAILIGGVVIPVIFAITMLRSGREQRRKALEAEQLANTIVRLVNLISSFHETLKLAISEQFEFELRLSEAEVVLRVYEREFYRTDGSLLDTITAIKRSVEGRR